MSRQFGRLRSAPKNEVNLGLITRIADNSLFHTPDIVSGYFNSRWIELILKDDFILPDDRHEVTIYTGIFVKVPKNRVLITESAYKPNCTGFEILEQSITNHCGETEIIVRVNYDLSFDRIITGNYNFVSLNLYRIE